MSYRDEYLTCSECGQLFAFSAEDQQLFGELGYDRPERCRLCWRAREEQRRAEGGSHTPTWIVQPGGAQQIAATIDVRKR
jgi:hypothetical protein